MDGRGDGGSYIDFGRSEEYVNFGTEGNQAFTVEFWVKVTKGGGKDQNVFLSTYMGGDGWRNGWMMYWRNADGGIIVQLGAKQEEISVNLTKGTGRWRMATFLVCVQ